ncbi:unnamed protein product [Mycena citricolor]|uniref:Sacsin/Nov domain-containing protein n=1 Tax=Mycena citricolor TaxID=2018698 RepID=A0AAD2HMA9_9AGAR|nr:unnamed protein product [Mycena citricolor]
MPRNFREKVDVTKDIKGILEAYPYGNGILRELLQNSDDAGARSQIFILDTRNHPCATLVDKELIASQGPALVAINDTLFSEADWQALSNLRSSSKVADETHDFPLFFMSMLMMTQEDWQVRDWSQSLLPCQSSIPVLNGYLRTALLQVTDNPHFLSGRTLVIFDPHHRFSGENSGGVRLDAVTERTTYPDQFRPFDDCDSEGAFDGTIVRLPLRDNGARSKIKTERVTVDEIRSLFDSFVKQELSTVMLFLKHILSITLKVVLPDGSEELVGRAEVVLNAEDIVKREFLVEEDERTASFHCAIRVDVPQSSSNSQTWHVLHSARDRASTASLIGAKLGYDVEEKLRADKLFAHVALAFPVSLSDGFRGRLFTLLPLPIYTEFPMHVHAIFTLTQDRQSLRNINETGRLLVTWNRMIFDQLLPDAWASFLLQATSAGWWAWPPAATLSEYWAQILPNLIRVVLAQDMSIFPQPDAVNVPLSAALLALNDADPGVLMVLRELGICIVQPPQYITEQIFAIEPGATRMTPTTNNLQSLAQVSEAKKDHLLRYLVESPGSPACIFGLPLLPSFDGPRVSLMPKQPYVLVDAQAGQLFGDSSVNGSLIALERLPVGVDQFTLFPGLNFSRFGLAQVQVHLQGSEYYRSASDEAICTDAQRIWLLKFWQWLASSPIYRSSWQILSRFHLLPTTRSTLRRLDSLVLSPMKDSGTQCAWENLGVPFLDPSFADCVVEAALADTEDVKFMLECITVDPSALSTDQLGLIREHLTVCLRTGRKISLETRTREVYRQLPIFPTRVPHEGAYPRSQVVYGAVASTVICVAIEDSHAIPFPEADSTFVDATHRSRSLVALLDAPTFSAPLSECGVLEMCILQEQLVNQPPSILNTLLDRIVHRLSDLSDAAKERLKNTPFVTVDGVSQRMAPKDLIHPRSPLAQLYSGEPGRLPSGKWASGIYLTQITSHVPFQSSLTRDMIEERIAFVAEKGDPVKARHLLALVDQEWSSLSADDLIVRSRDVCWIPSQFGVDGLVTLEAPPKCRGHGDDRHLFDLVLHTSDADPIKSPALRQALGWGRVVPVDVLRQQLEKTLDLKDARTATRMRALILAFADVHADECPAAILQSIVAGRPWIPVRDELIETRHALLERASRLDRIGGFRVLPRTFSDDANVVAFLKRMGCDATPSLETLLSELHLGVSAISLLQAIAPLLVDCSAAEFGRVVVPDDQGSLRPIVELYYPDTTSDPLMLLERFPTHASISKSDAVSLRIPFLSALHLDGDEGEDEDEDQMGEDLTTRVSNILKDYAINYALNEFLANAIDAHATQFSLLLDGGSYEDARVIAPGLADLQTRPALILWNDAVFDASDFAGIRKVGQGGKTDNPHSIGRFGLGALSLFHFGDIVQIVSGKSLLVLDPTGRYLPPLKKSGKPRTALLRSLSDVARRWPDQLAPFEGVNGFKIENLEYRGTLFRIALRTSSSALAVKPVSSSQCLNLITANYFQLARDAMYFTPLVRIQASKKAPGKVSALWEVSARRNPLVAQDTNHEHQILTVQASKHATQHWVVSKSVTSLSDVPPEHMPSVTRKADLVVQMAMKLPNRALSDGRQHKRALFSSLSLPIETSLSAHISAPFALSPDRRNIRFEPADGSGRRVPDAAYNVWILRELVPRVHLALVHCATDAATRKVVADLGPSFSPFQWWPVRPSSNGGVSHDSISRLVVEGFYRHAWDCELPICKIVSGELAPPKEILVMPAGSWTVGDVLEKLMRGKPGSRFAVPPTEVHRLFLLAKKDSAQSKNLVDSSFVKAALETHGEKLVELYEKGEHGITTAAVHAMVLFLGSVSIQGLPLLALASPGRRLVCPDPAVVRYIHHAPGAYTGLFSPETFLDPVSSEVRDLLLSGVSDANVKLFDAAGDWIARFWDVYPTLPGPPAQTSFADLPLISTNEADQFLSESFCQSNDRVFSYPVKEAPALLAVMGKLGMLFCIKASIVKPFDINTFLEAVRTTREPLSALDSEEVQKVAQWLTLHLSQCTGSVRTVLAGLPIWIARDRWTVVKSAADTCLLMLPRGVHPGSFNRYVRSGVALAGYSPALHTVLQWCRKSPSGAVDRESLLRALQLPTALHSPGDVEAYRELLKAFLDVSSKSSAMAMIPIPAGDLQLRTVDSLYDNEVELFAGALRSQSQSLFVHPSFRQFQDRLALRREPVDRDAFLLCARTVHEDLTERGLAEDEVLERANLVWAFYSAHESRLGVSPGSWESSDRLRFVVRAETRSTSSTFPVLDQYLDDKDPHRIVSPNELLKAEYEPIAWTQRVLFREEPSWQLTRLNPSLGVPSVEQVVKHLRVLALEIAPHHEHNRSLLAQIRSTYKWLNSHCTSAREYLVQHEQDALFLNVADPEDRSESWHWRSAAQLVFDIPRDFPNSFRVLEFLLEWRVLVVAAGGSVERDVEEDPSLLDDDEGADGGDALRRAFDGMRQSGELCDMWLVPTDDASATDEPDDELRVHSAFLAAAIPHVKIGLLGWSEGVSRVYEFPGTRFGALALIEFIYTGQISHVVASCDGEAILLVENLLALLSVADLWDMPQLKAEVMRIVRANKLLSRDTYARIHEAAEDSRDERLVSYCEKWREINPNAVLQL